MSSLLDDVDRRTQMVGQNRLELLLFTLGTRQLFAINVFKVREVITCPALSRLPSAHPIIRGVATLRGKTVSVVDLAQALSMSPVGSGERGSFVILTEFNRSVQGLLVASVDRIINLNWDQIRPPPRGTHKDSFLTAVTQVDDRLVEIIDVEKVLEMVTGPARDVSDALVSSSRGGGRVRCALVADDSTVARKQIVRALTQIGVESVVVNDGRQALDKLLEMAAQGPIEQQIGMVISDIEMPEMDGYTLSAAIRKEPALSGLYVVLHSSLSGTFNETLVRRAGADRFLPKFSPDELAEAVLGHLQMGDDAK
ncbi:chemotaxis protein [Ectothiorhodospira lacustris]|uniref:chemotaxis protein n=1 Tax=Ectothiorhodospira lacustris TaxID=2899127 RepID=UPI001EE8AF43|nr:chemotaxis protein [Ectothiorhodospira lacustris]MCG5499839.1 chemotaxis protein [Ectothiorhodospira lacustris]MCG5511028.1 chemotaxis protein [Ectothiorhodospira lacustris]MCG5522758.1 chemotaxis protein [Ectothiorhodospira lacustris]